MERRNTRQRQLVLAAVREMCDHPTADEIYLRVREQDDHISRGTVYRNLHLLADTGEILSVKTPGGERFDRRLDHHAHLVCPECGSVVDVPAPEQDGFRRQIERSTGYADVSTSTILTGVCPACQKGMRRGDGAPAAAGAR
ncbi:MAG: transcriptional repressor [Coriobacteriaceae bacterium]|uniref:Fur family transcriptional regulator n=1 Tax=Tractidigestivibacter sp. TaxID=2847320 RepID=UPI002A80D1A4|nr:transcriptional repressor [Tractidigestivibacter sp.]MCI6273459.1 transcriptional repressor [Coriobacteriaceae bacterium]MCI6547378.1 transcriptional repressor [Coriobacteriaceae bacterium]MCI6844289.1 transcriptional repressor [Coriobacteriaceae bacterium]MCI7438043.1 transcriptional repressor [Coriobacteriaceae bacterium]MDD7585211.1 transcriptional repressor [Coriobacteriaceae bacterium]